MSDRSLTDVLTSKLRLLYSEKVSDVPFHGWHHVEFVVAKACEFARELEANAKIVHLAALVHDVNYLVDTTTSASGGSQLRAKLLRSSGADAALVQRIERVVLEAETKSRNAEISREAMALSDADTAFKVLPITPVILAPLYMRETGVDLRSLARKIVQEQVPLQDEGIYFYSKSGRRRYEEWGQANLRLWQCILDSLDEPEVVALLESDSLRGNKW
jgi:uncharacterized protein